jgi:hypothetical protein
MNAVTEQDARSRLSRALRALRECCYPPLGEALWPTDAQLHEFDLVVVGLANMERKREITMLTPFWKAYELINKRSPGIRLVSSLNALVNRASQRVKEAESVVERVKAIPLLQWILDRGNPDYIRKPEWSYLQSLYEDSREQRSMETNTRKRELARLRKQEQRAREKRSKKQNLKKAC